MGGWRCLSVSVCLWGVLLKNFTWSELFVKLLFNITLIIYLLLDYYIIRQGAKFTLKIRMDFQHRL